MYTKSLFPAMLLAVGLFFTACEKNNTATPDQEDVAVAEDAGLSDYLIEDVEQISDDAVALRSGNAACPEMTFAEPEGTFPNVVTIDFGDACEGPNGHVRSGKIIITQSAHMHEAGAVRVTEFEDFFVDDVQVLGTKTLENLGVDDNGNVTFKRTVANAQLLFPDGSSTSWEATQTKTQVAGGETPEFFDDVFEITGSSSGVNRNGVEFSSEITTPLVKSRNCRWVSDGVRTVSFGVRNWSIDYGFPEGECDRLALVTLGNGETKIITLHRRRW